MKTAKCSCGSEAASSTMVAEESSVSVANHEVHGVQRNFDGVCSVHGPFWQGVMGNHSTLSEKRLKAFFPKTKRKLLKGLLSGAEGKMFRQPIEGKRIPTDEEVNRWLELSS